jgi:hypothetical protein
MDNAPRRRNDLLALLGIGLAIGIVVYLAGRGRTDRNAVFHQVVVELKNLHHKPGYRNSEGYWVGDVAELHRMGLISREVAEADSAPLRPLVNRPKPFHGYYVVAMESYSEGDKETQLKGIQRNKGTFAFCIYPADQRQKGLSVYLVCPEAIYRKECDGSEPILKWPKNIRGTGQWWMVD